MQQKKRGGHENDLTARGHACQAASSAATSDTARVLLDKAAPPVADDQPQVNGTIEDGQRRPEPREPRGEPARANPPEGKIHRVDPKFAS